MSIENLYPSVKPSLDLNFAAGNFDPRITFSRASGATHYDGKTVAKAEENLLTYSQEFDNAAWVKTTSTVIANSFAAPDGTVSADTVTAASADSKLLQTFSATADLYTFSVYLYRKTGTGNVDISVDGVTWVTQTVTSGWVRFSTTLTPSAGAKTAGIRLAVSGDEVYIWGAQLEQRSQATAYTPTTSQPITNYAPVLQTAAANVPRIDYDPITGECKGLLVEEQRTNLIDYSEQFDNAVWVKYLGATVQSNVSVAPDGNLSADLLFSTSSQEIYNITSKSLVSEVYTFSIYAKRYNIDQFAVILSDFINGGATYTFNLAAGTAVASTPSIWSNSSASIVHVGNGWYRCTGTATSPATNAVNVSIKCSSSVAGVGIYIWGAQLESGSFPTSYIKTEASQATRAADSASMTGTNFSSWYRQDEGTLFAEFSKRTVSSRGIAVSIGAPITNTSNDVSIDGSGGGKLRAYYEYNGSVVLSKLDLGNYVPELSNKVIVSFRRGSSNASSNFVIPGADINQDVLQPRMSVLSIGCANSVTGNIEGYLNGHIKRITYYPKRLSNTELQAITA